MLTIYILGEDGKDYIPDIEIDEDDESTTTLKERYKY